MLEKENNTIGFTGMTNNYVFPVKIKNVNQPWIEIVDQLASEYRPIIVIELKVGSDQLDLSTTGKNPAYGCYKARDIAKNTYQIDIHCLKNSNSFKYVRRSVEIALTRFLLFDLKIEKYRDDFPIFIINTRCESCNAPLSTLSEMIREITVSTTNSHYLCEPYIFVAFDDMNPVWYDNEPKKDKKKKKKKKKK